MATNINTILSWFKTGFKPTQSQFWASWTSFWHKDEVIPQTSINGLTTVLNAKTENDQFNAHKTDPDAHAESIGGKLDKDSYPGTAKTLSNEIAAIKFPDTLLEFVKPTRVGNTLTFPDYSYVARINQIHVQNIGDFTTTIDAATDNYHRTDLIELRANGTFNKIVGDESLTAARKPDRSDNAVEVSTIDVFGNTIYDPSDPFDPTDFLPKGGYSGTAQDLANATPDLNASNLKLGGYPNTRNDGQIPMNRVLGTDANGYLKMYTIAISPAPFLEVLIPGSTLPSTRTDFVLKGAFFTPSMTVSIVGQTINYVTFISDNLVKVNVTTGSAEGNFAVTLNNGLSATFEAALMIVLGTVFAPSDDDWVNIQQPIDFLNGMPVVKTWNSLGSAVWNKQFDTTKNISIRFSFARSPLGGTPSESYKVFMLFDAVTLTELFSVKCRSGKYGHEPFARVSGEDIGSFYYFDGEYGNYNNTVKDIGEFRYIAGIWYFYLNNVLRVTYTQHTNYVNPVQLKVSVAQHDTKNIKYIELAI